MLLLCVLFVCPCCNSNVSLSKPLTFVFCPPVFLFTPMHQNSPQRAKQPTRLRLLTAPSQLHSLAPSKAKDGLPGESATRIWC